jgi:hypothetical protein
MARFTADVSVPHGLAVKAARHRQRRRRAAAAITGAGSIAAVTVVIVTAAAVTPGQVGSQHAQTVAYVIGRTEAALAAVASQNLIQYSRQTTTGGIRVDYAGVPQGLSYAVWIYPGKERIVGYGADGMVMADYGTVTAAGQRTTTLATYRDKTWWRQQITLPPQVAPTPEPACEAATVVEGGAFGISDWAAEIRAALSCGQYKIAGSGQVDGVHALKLVPADPPHGMSAVLWIDPSTYLPVRDVVSMSWHGTVQEDFRWLRPTAVNLARLDVPIPAGFTQVAPPAP